MSLPHTSCADVRSQLPLHVGRELDGRAAAAVDAHLATCETCSERALAHVRLRDAFRAAAPSRAELDAELAAADPWPGIRAALRSEGLVQSRSQGRSGTILRFRRAASMAAAAAVLGFAFLAWGPELLRGPDPAGPAGSSEIASPNALRAQPISAPAGGLVRLSPGEASMAERARIEGQELLLLLPTPGQATPNQPGMPTLASQRRLR